MRLPVSRLRSFPTRLLAIPPAVLLLAGVLAPAAPAATLSWKQATSGNAGIGGNWVPGQIPGSGDALVFNLAGAYTVTFDVSVPSVTSHTYKLGTVTLVAGGHSTSNTVTVGSAAGDNAIMALTTGTLTTGSSVVIGGGAGSTGALNVNDDDADLLQSGTTSDFLVGSLGTGALNVTGGGLADAADDVTIGLGAAAIGSALVSGVNVSPSVRSTLSTSGSEGDLTVGNAGTGTLTVNAGGLVSSSDDVRIASGNASHGTVTIDGATGAIVSQLTVADDLDLSRNDTAGAACGIGTLRVQNFGLVSVAGTTRVGDPDGGTGRLEIRPQGIFSSHDLLFDDAHGVLDFQGGTLSINGGTFNPPGTAIAVDDDQFESLQFHNGATATFDGGSASGYGLIVGDAQEGGVNLDSGAHVTHTQGVLSIANAPGSVGVLNVTGDALIDGAGRIIVGQGGNGELNMGTGAGVFLTEMNVAYSAGSNGFVDVEGAGARLALELLSIGGHGSTAGGSGTVIVGNGGLLDVPDVNSPAVRILAPGGSMTVQAGGTVNVASNFDLAGHIQMAGGTINVLSLNLPGSGNVTGFGTVNGRVAMNATTNVIHAVGGPLILGTNTSDKGFNSIGTLICESPVTLRDLDAVTLGNVVLGPGSLGLPSMGGTVQAGKTMSGAGTVAGSLTMTGNLSPGASAGLIVVHGVYTQSATGKMTLEIGNASTGEYDRLVVTSTANLAGTLDIKILPGFSPDPGEEFAIVQCGISRSGTFSALTLNGQPVGGQFSLIYNPTNVVLHVNGIVDGPGSGWTPSVLAFLGRSGTRAAAGFELALPEGAHVELRVYDARGRALGTLLAADVPAGVERLPLRDLGSVLPGGVYFGRARIRTPAGLTVRTAKVILTE